MEVVYQTVYFLIIHYKKNVKCLTIYHFDSNRTCPFCGAEQNRDHFIETKANYLLHFHFSSEKTTTA